MRPLSAGDVVTLEVMTEADDEGAARLGMPPAQWWQLVRDNPHRYGWMILQDGEEVGYLDAEQEGRFVYVALLVFRDRRGRGIAGQVIHRALAEPVFCSAEVIIACVELNNHAARRLARSVGFVETGLDADGLMTYHLAPPSVGTN